VDTGIDLGWRSSFATGVSEASPEPENAAVTG
jgi:hypothetical protein